jgi:Na+/H+ antiporter NhaA
MESFVKWGASAALMLLIAAIAALIFANVGFSEQYEFLRYLKRRTKTHKDTDNSSLLCMVKHPPSD